MQHQSTSTTLPRRFPENPPITAEIFAQNRRWRGDPARKPYVQKYWLSTPKSYRRTYLQAATGRSPKAAIKIFCLECVGWQRKEVTRCTALGCPLYAYRPFQGATRHLKEKAAS